MPDTRYTSPQTSQAVPDVNAKDVLIASIGADAEAHDRPDWRDPESSALERVWETCRDAFEGTDALIANARKYLPKHKSEKPADYRARCDHSAVFNSFAATINGLTGLAFAKEPSLGEDVHEKLRDHAENIDGAGTPLNVFARELTEEALNLGTAGFMVLYPPRPEGATAKDEKEGTLRPYWRAIAAEDIMTWDHANIGARDFLTHLVVREQVRQRHGRYGSRMVMQYREFIHDIENDGIGAPVTYIVWEERRASDRDKRPTLVPVSIGTITTAKGASLSRIPYVGVLFGRKRGKMFARPPLKDLLDLMLKAFRIDSDRSYLMHLACVPIPVRKGYKSPVSMATLSQSDGSTITVPRSTGGSVAAPNVLMDLPADTPNASGVGFTWAEIQGTAFAPTKDELEKLKAEMGAIGMQFLAPSTRAAETADARRQDARVDNATLSAMLSVLESAIEEGLIIHAEYVGVGVRTNTQLSGGSWTVNRDFERTLLGPDMIKVYSELVLADQLTLETFLEILTQGRALPDGFNVQQEIRRLRQLAGDREKSAEARMIEMQNATGAQSSSTDDEDDEDDDATNDAEWAVEAVEE
jgi:hypothetical protein